MSDLQQIDNKLSQIDSALNQIGNVEQSVSTWWSVTNAMTISASILIFGLIVFCLATYLVKIGKNIDTILRFFGTTLIIVMAVFLVVAGYSDKQIGPVMGLLGTIAGYLLGKDTKDNKDT